MADDNLVMARVLSESKAIVQEQEHATWIPKGAVRRFWRNAWGAEIGKYAKFLRSYASGDNYPTATQAVTNPVLFRKGKESGTWRQVRVGVVWQTFREKEGESRELVVFQDLVEVTAGFHWEYASFRSSAGDEDTHGYLRMEDKIDAPDDTPGVMWRSVNTMNEDDGTYDIDVRRTTRNARTRGFTLVQWPASQGQIDIVQYDAAAALPSLRVNSPRNIYRRRWAQGEDGLYDGEEEYEQTTSNEFGPILSGRIGGLNETMYLYENRDSWVEFPAGYEGRGRWTRNPEDNTWNGSLSLTEVVVSIDWTNERDYEHAFLSTRGEFTYVYVKFTTSATNAETHIQTVSGVGYTVVGGRDGHVTDLRFMGRGRIKAKRVETKDL